MLTPWIGVAITLGGIYAIKKLLIPGKSPKVEKKLLAFASEQGLKNDFIHSFQGTGLLIDKDRQSIAVIGGTNNARSEADFVRRIVERKDINAVSWETARPGIGRLVIKLNDFNVPAILVAGYEAAIRDIYDKLCLVWSLK
jgi:hypothetical protein